MQESDKGLFSKAFARLCAAFNTPPTEPRREAYFRAFRRISALEFTGLIDAALIDSELSSMPTVGQLWALHERIQPKARDDIPQLGPTIAEQLCEYAAIKLHGRLEPLEYSMPWNYVYREWREGDKRCAECIGVVIDRHDGRKIGFSAAQMREDTELYDYVLRKCSPGFRPDKDRDPPSRLGPRS